MQGWDKAARVARLADLEAGLRKAYATIASAWKSGPGRQGKVKYVASLQVDAIILELLTTRALWCRNIREIRIGINLIEKDTSFVLKFGAGEMKGHRAFETTAPLDLSEIIRGYLHPPFTGGERSPRKGSLRG